MENENSNYLRDMVHVSLKLGEYTKVPFLLLSSPGLGKTSMIRSWCQKEKYELTTLVGSQRTAEEILGYMVNNGTSLVTYTPDWYNEIIANDKNGRKTALFIDELSTAPENVQGSMLQLIFDRKVGGNNYLPESTLVIAAANYKGNLPPQNSIMAPTLNRFCLINLEPEDPTGLIAEFLQSDEEMNEDLIQFGNIQITDKTRDLTRTLLRDIMTKLVATYAKSEGSINTSNQDYNDLYEKNGKIYNFMSGRTISYLYRCCLGLVHLDLCRKRFQGIIDNIVYGLIGAGTNSFNTPTEQSDWLVSATQSVRKVLRSIMENKESIQGKKVNLTYGIDTSENISKWLLYSESNQGDILDDNLTNLIDSISKAYGTDIESMLLVLESLDTKAFMNDMAKITDLNSHLKQSPLKELSKFVTKLETILVAYDCYKNQLLKRV